MLTNNSNALLGHYPPGWSLDEKIANDYDLAQILGYDGPDERLMVGQSRDAKPSQTGMEGVADSILR